MNLQLINCFIAIVENGNITKAAEKMFLSQPAITKMLKNLEAEYGCLFFDRNGKRLILNEKGKILYKHAKDLQEKINDFEKTVEEELAVKIAADKRITVLTDFDYMPRIFAPYLAKYENFAYIYMKINDLKDYESDLINGNCDIAITYEKPKNNELTSFFLFRDHIYVLCPFDLKHDTKISLEQLQKLPFANIISKKYKASWSTNFVKEKRLKLNYKLDASSEDLFTLRYASDFCYFSYYSYILVSSFPSNRVPVPIDDIDATREVYLVYKKTNAGKIDKFVEIVKNHYNEMFNLRAPE